MMNEKIMHDRPIHLDRKDVLACHTKMEKRCFRLIC